MAKSPADKSKKRPEARKRGHVARAFESNGFPIVGIGASAGGLEAMTQFLKGLPAGTGMSLVLVQHLDPTHESALASILARTTHIPVSEAKHNMQLAPNHLYVIPHNKFMGVRKRRLLLSPRQEADSGLAVDHFFRMLAESEGSRAIGVILSGNGSDGTQGCLAIKAAGGITFAQEEKSARYPSMPGSAVTAGCVDFVLPPEGIARELARLAGHPYVMPSIELEPETSAEERALAPILLLLRQRMRVDFTQYKPATLTRRIQRRMALQKIESLKEYTNYLRAHPAECKELYNDILIHVTGFFRDPGVFQLLKKKIFPRILKHKGPDEAVRIWVPGCSTGEEVYSLAIALTEFLSENKLSRSVQIFGTDIHDLALDKARAGDYPESIRADVSSERLRQFFAKADAGFRVSKNVREMCIFARQNVVVDPPFSNIDLISCRNLLIYLGHALQQKVLPLFHYALRADGFLLLGTSESIGGFADLFALADRKAKVYSKKATRIRTALSFGRATPDLLPATKDELAIKGLAPNLYDVQRQADRILLTYFSPAGVLINRHMEVLQFRGHTGQYLEHTHGEASLNLLKMAREGLALDLRTTIAQALKQGTRVVHERSHVKQNGDLLEVNIEVLPFSTPPSTEKFCLVLFRPWSPVSDGPPAARKRDTVKAERGGGRAAAEQERLQEELLATRESLQAVIEEREATNEELRSANEEIMSSNEELQSTNEEMETAKEELQSTNEELTTLNDELESRNTELETVNNDLQNLLAATNIPIIILGHDLRIRRFTSMAERLFNLIPGDMGRPITDINLPLNIPHLGKQVAEVLDNLALKELEVRDKQGRWWQVRIRPYKTADNKIEGAVITALDIDMLKNNVQLANQGRAFAEAVLDTVHQPMVALDAHLVVQFLNPEFCKLFKLEAEQALHKPLYQLADGRLDIPSLRTLLEETLAHDPSKASFEVQHDFPGLGPHRLRLNARRLAYSDALQLTLVAIEKMEAGE